MKKLLVLLMVLAMAAPAMADDTLDLSGAMRVRAWSIDNVGFSDADGEDHQYWDQRLRIQGKIKPADGVMAVFRVDFAEEFWGGNTWQGSRYSVGISDINDDGDNGGELQVDRAYLDVTKGMINYKAGLQYMGLGNNYAYDNNATGIQVTVMTPATIRVGYAKIDEDPIGDFDDATDLSDEDGYEDTDHLFFDVGYKTDDFSVNVFYVMQTDGTDTADEPTLMGAMGKFMLGPANVFAELNVFGGSTDDGDTDYVGSQFIADASMKLNDMATVGANLIYSTGTDDSDETKVTRFPNAFFGSQYYSDLGPFNTDIGPFGSGDVFDPGGFESGAVGAGVYGNFEVMPGLVLSAQYVYLQAQEDGTDTGDGFDTGYTANVGVKYTVTDNAHIAGTYLIADWDDIDGTLDPETLTVTVLRLQVDF